MRKQFEKVDEFNMPVERLERGSEYPVVREKISVTGEWAFVTDDAVLPKEYPGAEKNDRRTKSDTKKKRRYSRLVQKMGYLVASTVAVVAIGNTLDPEMPKRPEIIYPGKGSAEEWKDIVVDAQGGINGESQGTADVVKYGHLKGTLTMLQNGWQIRSGDGFLHDEYDEKFYDYQGKLLDPGFDVTYINELYASGYARVQRAEDLAMYLLNAQGEVIMQIEEIVKNLNLPEDVAVYEEYYGEIVDITEDIICETIAPVLGEAICLRLRNIKTGEVIKEISVNSWTSGIWVNDFCEDVMPVFICEQKDYSYTWGLLYTDGRFRVLKEANLWEYHEDTTGQKTKAVPTLGAITDGSMVIIQYLEVGEGEYDDRYTFIDIETGETVREYMKADFQKEYGENARISDSLRNYGLISSASGDILFDFADMDGRGILSKRIASYDKIFLKDSPYLLVREGQAYYYIDWSGNVVGGPYVRAAQFSKDGYAAVQKEEYVYEVSILSDQMEEVERIYGAGLVIQSDIDVENILDVFPLWFSGEYRYTDANGSEPMKDIADKDFGAKRFVYYYNPS